MDLHTHTRARAHTGSQSSLTDVTFNLIPIGCLPEEWRENIGGETHLAVRGVFQPLGADTSVEEDEEDQPDVARLLGGDQGDRGVTSLIRWCKILPLRSSPLHTHN